MRQLTDLLNDDWGSPKKGTYLPPCQNIENLSYDYSEKRGIDSEIESRFMVLVHFPNQKYRQITHVQEYDIENMLGNIGGYIGLFLGYSLLHLPHFLLSMWNTGYKNANKQNKVKLIQEEETTNKSNELKESTMLNGGLCLSCTQLKDVNTQVLSIARSLNNLESRVREVRDRIKESKSTPPTSELRKVRITEWDNSVLKIHYSE